MVCVTPTLAAASVSVCREPESPAAVVLVLPGGKDRSDRPFRPWQLASVRMVPFTRDLRRAMSDYAVWQVRYRYRGWNDRDPVRDAAWALDEARRRHPGAPVILVGHSMGGRVALRVSGDPVVRAVCALAPWLPPDEPVGHLAGQRILIAHGLDDRITDPEGSARFAERAKAAGAEVTFAPLSGTGHAMLRRAGDWAGLVRVFCKTSRIRG